mgnify:CR=1 FL=1
MNLLYHQIALGVNARHISFEEVGLGEWAG